MNFKSFFDSAREAANENFYNMDGFDDEFDFVDDEFDNAAGGVGGASVSQPYIVRLVNTTTADVSNVTMFGAYNAIASAGTQTGVNKTIAISGLTYTELLYQSMNKPFVVGLTYIDSSDTAQLTQTVSVTQKDINGNQAIRVLTPTIDPYQQQTTKVAFKYQYKIDGFTTLTLSTLKGSATADFYFYPAETVSTARALSGRRAVRGYRGPGIEKKQQVVLGGQARRALRG
jgi:hypothetical protein